MEESGTPDLPVADEEMDVDTDPENLPENDDEDMEDADKTADAAADAIADSVGHQDFSKFNESAENFSGEPKGEADGGIEEPSPLDMSGILNKSTQLDEDDIAKLLPMPFETD